MEIFKDVMQDFNKIFGHKTAKFIWQDAKTESWLATAWIWIYPMHIDYTYYPAELRDEANFYSFLCEYVDVMNVRCLGVDLLSANEIYPKITIDALNELEAWCLKHHKDNIDPDPLNKVEV